MFSVFATLAFT